MSALARIELVSDDDAVVDAIRSAAAAASRPFSVVKTSTPWAAPTGRAVRVVDLAAVRTARGPVPPLPDGLVLILPTDDRHACVRFHVYVRSAIDALIEELLDELPTTLADASELLIGESDAIRDVREQIARVAPYADVSVLISGETGTGKELVAQAIHERSRRSGSFVALNCAAIPEALFESELFGHEAGSFTGARTARVGLLETAANGTIFLDEIGEMPQLLQAKLLRVIETRAFRRVGANRDQLLEARIVSATNRPLHAVGDGHLRPDLLYRLAGFTIVLPPLRARAGDVELLAATFLEAFARRYRRALLRLSPGAMEALREESWPGNVRQLRTVVEQIAIGAAGPVIERDAVLEVLHRGRGRRSTAPPPAEHGSPRASGVRRLALRDVERELIVRAFDAAGGNVSRAAAELGISRSTLRDKLRRYGIGSRGDADT